MKIILQRITRAKIETKTVKNIQKGYVLFITPENDNIEKINKIVEKILKIKLWNEWKNSLNDMNYSVLLIDNIKTEKSINTMKDIYNSFINKIGNERVDYSESNGLKSLEFINDGPCTLIFDFR